MNFVLTQLHENYIQMTLNQVVKISSPEENASIIVIRDEIIPIENINDALYKYIWRHIESRSQVDYYKLHSKQDALYDFYWLENYKNALEALQQHVSEIVSAKGLFYTSNRLTPLM